MEKSVSMKKLLRTGISVVTALSMLSISAVSIASAASETTVGGEVLNSAEQGATGVYEITESGYYLINLKGANGGKGQDVHIQSDGVGSTDECKGNGYGYGGAGAEGGSVSTLVYLKKGQTLSYNVGADGTNYTEVAYRWEDLQRGCIHVYPNSNPIYAPEKYVDAGFGGGGGEGTYVSLGDEVIAGAAGGGGGGGSVAKCANWGEGSYYGFKDPSGEKSEGKNGGDASAVSATVSESFTDVASLNGQDGGKSQGESVQTGEYWPAVKFIVEIAPKAPKYKLTKFEAGVGGESGTSYINKTSGLYYGDDIPTEVANSEAYKNASAPSTSGIVITFVYAYEFPIKIEFSDGTTTNNTTTIQSGETVEVEIPKPTVSNKYFKGWFNKKGEKLTRDYYSDNKIQLSYDNAEDSEYTPQWYDASKMGVSYVSNAKAQAVSLSDGNGGKQKAIRFLAAIDSGYKGYTAAGFIISSESETPTIEAGYRYSNQSKLYKSVAARAESGEVTYLQADTMNDLFGFKDCVGLIYTNLVIKAGNEGKTYYATPYIVNADGEYVYGNARAISYNELASYDTEAVSD